MHIMKYPFILTLAFTVLFTRCDTDSNDTDPEGTHIFIVSLDNVFASSNCNSNIGGQARINGNIEIYFSTRDEGTPSKPQAEMDIETIVLNSGQSKSLNIELETDFVFEDFVLVEARITAFDSESTFDLEEEFWHSAFYSPEGECWYLNRSINPLIGCIPGSNAGDELFDTPYNTSMAGPDCQTFFEWRAKIEER